MSRSSLVPLLAAAVAVGVAVAAPVPKDTRPSPNPANLRSNLKQVGLALHNYHSAMGRLPAVASVDGKGRPLLSWRVMILPYLEQQPLFEQFKLDEPWDSEHNAKLLADNPMPKVYQVRGVTKDGDRKTHLRAFVGNGAAFDRTEPARFQDFTDGTVNTILAVYADEPVEWTKPDDLAFDPKADPTAKLWFDDGRTFVLIADGTIRALTKEKLTPDLLRALITRNGDEAVELR